MNDNQKIAYRTSDPAEIKASLDEPNTVFMVIATVAGVSQADLKDIYDKAKAVATARNPAVWRVLWIEHPENLDDSQDPDISIKNVCWGTGLPADPQTETCIVVLSLGTGMQRKRKAQYKPDELNDETDIMVAFTKG